MMGKRKSADYAYNTSSRLLNMLPTEASAKDMCLNALLCALMYYSSGDSAKAKVGVEPRVDEFL
jgi:hypothetical protein